MFITAAVLHLLLILFFTATVKNTAALPEQPLTVMKLMDFEEEVPPPLPSPPPPSPDPEPEPEPLPPLPVNDVESTLEAIAETMIETDDAPEVQAAAPGTAIASPTPVQAAGSGSISGDGEYLPMNAISVPPVFSEKEILAALVYPPISLRAGIEGRVYLELFVDRQGVVQKVAIVRETPPNRGFGEAAAEAFRGLKGKPAELNGAPAAVRYRYPVRFTPR